MDTLALVLSTPSPPAFIYIHHPHQPTSSVALNLPPASARVDAIECHTAKLLWSTIISRLEGKDAGVVDSLDMFIRRLRIFAEGTGEVKGRGKGKEKEREDGKRFSIVVTKAERLPKVMGSGWAVMTRLAELVSPSCVFARGELINRLISH
jgi:origin recognition complex subunit 5